MTTSMGRALVVTSLALLFLPVGTGTADAQQNRKKKPFPMPSRGSVPDFGWDDARDEMASFYVDPKSRRNEVVFISKAPKETITGKTSKVEGTLKLNPRRMDSATGQFSVAWENLDTGNDTRNQHMRASPWVNASSFPNVTLDVTGLKMNKRKASKSKTRRGRLLGTLSLNGKTKNVRIPVTFGYILPDPENPKVKEGLAIKARFLVALEDFDIKGKGVGQAVAKKQRVSVQLFMAFGEPPAADDQKSDTAATDGDADDDSGDETTGDEPSA